jgi:hypothetical protein
MAQEDDDLPLFARPDDDGTSDGDTEPKDEATLEAEQAEILNAVSAARLDTLQQKVAWILNNFPDTRNSDVELYKRFWRELESEYLDGDYVHLDNLFDLTRPTSLTRARAKLQNDYLLFQADVSVRSARGTLSDEERERAVEQQLIYPTYTVYMDESGKNAAHLVVGGAWFLHGPDLLEVSRGIEALAREHGFDGELHFRDISAEQLPFYQAVVDFVLERTATISFVSVSVERRGLRVQEAIQDLFFHLLAKGVTQHDETGRAPLPRSLTVFKDAEEPGSDRLMLANIRQRLRDAGAATFDGRLTVNRIAPADSARNVLIQLADLYVSSVSRVLNAEGARGQPRDRFANHFLERLGTPHGPDREEQVGDMTVHFAL